MTHSTEIEALLAITRTMLSAAEAGDWVKVGEQEQRRQTVLKTIDFQAALKGPGSGVVAANIKEVVALNDKLVELGVRFKKEMMQSAENLQRGLKAQNAYSGK